MGLLVSTLALNANATLVDPHLSSLPYRLRAAIPNEYQELFKTIAFYTGLGIWLVGVPWIMLRKKLIIFELMSQRVAARSLQMLLMLFVVALLLNVDSYIGFLGDDFKAINYSFEGELVTISLAVASFTLIYAAFIWVINFILNRRKKSD